MIGTTAENDIYCVIKHLIAEYELDWNVLRSTTTDGTPAMAGKHLYIVTKLEQETSENFVGFHHCVIHHESLASKYLKIDHVMQPIIKIDFIRSRGLNN